MPTRLLPSVLQRMATVREALRLLRVAHGYRGRWMFCRKHNLLDEAQESRRRTLEHLRRACAQWRLTLGMAG